MTSGNDGRTCFIIFWGGKAFCILSSPLLFWGLFHHPKEGLLQSSKGFRL